MRLTGSQAYEVRISHQVDQTHADVLNCRLRNGNVHFFLFIVSPEAISLSEEPQYHRRLGDLVVSIDQNRELFVYYVK